MTKANPKPAELVGVVIPHGGQIAFVSPERSGELVADGARLATDRDLAVAGVTRPAADASEPSA